MSKRAVVTLLLCINLALVALVILNAYTPPQAVAQGIARAGEYILVSGQVEVDNDAIYLIDLRTNQLHAFRTNFPRQPDVPTRVALMSTRDLNRDFGR